MSSSLISIVIPVYNTENYLEKCLKSITQQSYQNIEIIVINDGSTDSSLEIAQQVAQTDSRIKIFSQQNRGLSAARNLGKKKSNGELIMFVDSDDWLEENTCELLEETMRKTESDVVLCAYISDYTSVSHANYFFGNKEITWKDNIETTLWRKMVGPIREELREPQKIDSSITAWGKLFKKVMIESIDFVDTSIIGTEDALFCIEAFSKIQIASYIPRTLYHYRKNDYNSLTHKFKKNKALQWKELYKRIYDLLQQNNSNNIYYEALNNRICLGLIGLGINLVEDKSLDLRKKRYELFNMLSMSHYEIALNKMELKYFPIHWKLFFFSLKRKYINCSLLLLSLMNMLRGI